MKPGDAAPDFTADAALGVYSLKHELPIFSMGSNLVAYENQLREVMAGKAAKALERVMEARAT